MQQWLAYLSGKCWKVSLCLRHPLPHNGKELWDGRLGAVWGREGEGRRRRGGGGEREGGGGGGGEKEEEQEREEEGKGEVENVWVGETI